MLEFARPTLSGASAFQVAGVARALIVANRFVGGPVERPPHWGGYAVIPESIEFWQAGPGRIHQRLHYVRDGDGGWTAGWLFP